MSIDFKLFDTKTKQDLGTKYSVKNCLAEYLFPDVEFNIGIAYPEATVPEDLKNHDGKTLQFASKHRMIYASDPTIREQLYPNSSDGVAYPLPFTPCLSFHKLQNVRILVVDDVTGENGGVIADAEAKKIVGDCKGLIDKSLAEINGIKNVFQFRLGIKPQEQNPVMRIAKGTLAPVPLDFGDLKYQTSQQNIKAKTGYDLVLATSSFKGRKGEDAIAPGEYFLSEVGLGVKYEAVYRPHSLGTQVLVNYPRAVEQEILPIIEKQAQELAQLQKDPRKLALLYIKDYESRKMLNPESDTDFIDRDMDSELDIFDNLYSTLEEPLQDKKQDLLLYRLLKADLEGFSQILEHPKIITELQRFTRKKWTDIATGRSIKFTSGMAQPSLDLGLNEICIPHLPQGEEIIVTRSPLVNSNGVITLTNKHLSSSLPGCVYIHPKSAMDNLQCDFDGDYLAFAPSKKFPILATEVKEKLTPENRYPDIVKKSKIPYQGTFQEIACSAIENKIGLIANEIQKNVALQCEIDKIPDSFKLLYLEKISKNLNKILIKHEAGQLKIPPEFIKNVSSVLSSSNQNQIENKLQIFKKILKDSVGLLGNELQVAVDGPKSALRPDKSVFDFCQALTNYRKVTWLTEKKNPQVYLEQGIESNGYSPIDLMIQQTNKIFQKYQLTPRSIDQFRDFYSATQFTNIDKQTAQEIKANYNLLIKRLVELDEKKRLEPGPYLVISSPATGKRLEITNLTNFDKAKDVEFWNQNKMSIIVKSRKPTKNIPNGFQALLQSIVNGKQLETPIGTISLKSIQEHKIKDGIFINDGDVEFHHGISDDILSALRQQKSSYIDTLIKSTKNNDLQLAAALHDITHTPEKQQYAGQRTAGVAFAIFSDRVIDQLQELQFDRVKVLGTHLNDFSQTKFNHEKLPVRFEDAPHPSEPNKTVRWLTVNDKKLGVIAADSPQLISGSQAIASINSISANSFIITSPRSGEQLQVDNINKYDFASKQWQSEQCHITLEVREAQGRNIVIAKLDNQVLGVLNKKSADFMQQRLLSFNKQIQGFRFNGVIDNASPRLAEVIIDPSTVEFPQAFDKDFDSHYFANTVEKVEDVSPNKSSASSIYSNPIRAAPTSNKSPGPKIVVSNHNSNLDHKQTSSDIKTVNLTQHKAATVIFLESTNLDGSLKQQAQQVLFKMAKRAVNRALEQGYSQINFINISPYKDENSSIVSTIKDSHKHIKIQSHYSNDIRSTIHKLKSPDDIFIAISNFDTKGIIDFVASQGKATAAYIPQTRNFEKYNLPQPKKQSIANKSLQIELD